MTAPIRIAFARINQETHALSPMSTTMTDFERDHFLEGDALTRACAWGAVEVKGFGKNLELSGFVRACREHATEVEAVPLFSAWTSPNGPLTDDTIRAFVEKLTASLRAVGPVDGVFLSLHGAMGARGIRDPETRFLEAVKAVIGDKPIAVTYDLHGNLTKERVALTDVLVAYKTNPHRDHATVGFQSGTALIDAIVGAKAPTRAWRSLPMLLGGGNTIDFLNPMRAIWKRARAMEQEPGVIAASVFTCHPWNSDPALGWSVCVITDGDQAKAERLADELAERCWGVKDALPPKFLDAEAGITKARKLWLARKTGVVTMSDASDVTSAGAPGGSTKLVRALLAHATDMVSYAGIRDPHAIETLWTKAEGERVTIDVGGRLDPTRDTPLTVTGRVFSKTLQTAFERVVVLDLGHVKLAVCEGPALIIKPDFYLDAGLSLWKADIVVVKNFFPFLLFYAPYNRWSVFVRTGGLTDFDASYALSFDGPMHPRDVVDDWRPRDRARRGLDEAPSVARRAA